MGKDYRERSLNLGIIGFSDGNGHPYSWSAIFNGYNSKEMEHCGFPAIPRYLEHRKFPDDQIKEANVTHIWTQDQCRSRHIALSTNIPVCVKKYEDMIGAVDGILLARDDAENHYQFCKPFLESGLPVYVDKPIALSKSKLKEIYALEQYPGQIFTCSALRYAQELSMSDLASEQVGSIKLIYAMTPKDWNRYSVHIIEPVLSMIGHEGNIIKSKVDNFEPDIKELFVERDDDLKLRFSSMGKGIQCPISIRVMGCSGFCDLTLKDTFSAFKSALQDFVDGILQKDVRTNVDLVYRVVDLIELGQR